MSTDSLTSSPETIPASTPVDQEPEARWRFIARFALAALVAAGLSGAVWPFVPRKLSGPLDIVGYPTFVNYEFEPPFWIYRLSVIVFPALLIAIYALLAWRGPLQRKGIRRSGPIALVPPPSTSEPALAWLGAAAKISVAAGVVTLAATARNGVVGTFAIACGAAYVAAVLAIAMGWSLIAGRGFPGTRQKVSWEKLALVNGVAGAIAALIGLWFVSARTTVFLPQGATQTWPWLPLWLALAGIAATLAWSWHQMRQGTAAWRIERILLIAVSGSVAIFLATSVLPGEIAAFQGFDDAQEMAGTGLMGRGFFPWRDFMFIHGLFPDALTAGIGTSIFGDTVWGVIAGKSVLLAPLCWVVLFLYTAWVSRGNVWFLALFSTLAVGGFLPPVHIRFMLVPLSMILLAETLRRHSRSWCAGLVLVLFVQSILAPETMFFALPALVCVALADLVHREPGKTWWQALRRTRWSIAAGLVYTAAFVGWLMVNGAFSGFLDYYIIHGPGHNLAGAIPLTAVSTKQFIFWLSGAIAVLLTVWDAVARLRRRSDWTGVDWMALAAAGFIAFYEEKGLGRFDGPHADQVFMVALPLIVLWVWKGLSATGTVSRVRVASALSVLLLLGYAATAGGALKTKLTDLPTQHRITASSTVDSPFSRIGYVTPTGVDQVLLQDLDTVLRTYAGADEPVFDMTNSLGYLYYVLGREPGTRFAHVSMAITPYSQKLAIGELSQSRPPVIVWDSRYMGLPEWDGPRNNVRHYEISDFILDGWVPLLKSHENIILIRKDLAPSIPVLLEPPVTDDLWFSGFKCDWGYTSYFMESAATGTTLTVPVKPVGKGLSFDYFGWALDPQSNPVESVILASGQKAVFSAPPSAKSTFQLINTLQTDSANLGIYALAKDGTLYPVEGGHGTATEVTLADGRTLPVAQVAVGGLLSESTAVKTISEVAFPAGTNLGDFDLATLTASGPLGQGEVILTDQIGLGGGHYITAKTRGDQSKLSIRASSCLQWRGYDPAKPLYVLQEGGNPVTSLSLSGVGG